MSRTTQVLSMFMAIIIIIFLVMAIEPLYVPSDLYAEGETCYSCTVIGECAACQIEYETGEHYHNCSLPDCETCKLTGPGC